jgi:hypothetical protein
VTEEGKRDVQMLAGDDPQRAVQLGGLPRLELVERVLGKAEGQEQA